ncbi:hypothetical protein ACFWYW_26095 [Nonomuraea sp. NPDC059023]|uniref:hypothetical protein n=1 Tax=unclassified Nonomuraea TaxID=2593643 RepID=UPI0036CD88A1
MNSSLTLWRIIIVAVSAAGLTDEQREEVVHALPGYPTMSDDVATGQLIVEFDLESSDEQDAINQGEKLFTKNAREILGDVLTYVGITAWREGDDSSIPRDFLQLVGYAEIASLLQVSRQRVRELAETRADFPAPIARLAMGPVFTLRSVQDFLDRWDRRRVGRPKKARV